MILLRNLGVIYTQYTYSRGFLCLNRTISYNHIDTYLRLFGILFLLLLVKRNNLLHPTIMLLLWNHQRLLLKFNTLIEPDVVFNLLHSEAEVITRPMVDVSVLPERLVFVHIVVVQITVLKTTLLSMDTHPAFNIVESLLQLIPPSVDTSVAAPSPLNIQDQYNQLISLLQQHLTNTPVQAPTPLLISIMFIKFLPLMNIPIF